MTNKLQIHVSNSIATKYNQDSWVENMATACEMMGMQELIEMIDLHWGSEKENSRLSINVIYMTIGIWEASIIRPIGKANF